MKILFTAMKHTIADLYIDSVGLFAIDMQYTSLPSVWSHISYAKGLQLIR